MMTVAMMKMSKSSNNDETAVTVVMMTRAMTAMTKWHW